MSENETTVFAQLKKELCSTTDAALNYMFCVLEAILYPIQHGIEGEIEILKGSALKH